MLIADVTIFYLKFINI